MREFLTRHLFCCRLSGSRVTKTNNLCVVTLLCMCVTVCHCKPGLIPPPSPFSTKLVLSFTKQL